MASARAVGYHSDQMNLDLLPFLADPKTGRPLTLEPEQVTDGRVLSGRLVSSDGAVYSIIRGIPRFVEPSLYEGVRSFGDQWNHFNFNDFKENWRCQTIANTFGSTDYFRGKVIVHAGGGSGAQSLWMLESGAERVILLELSHSVDEVVTRNIESAKWPNFDVIQCSIDSPPLAASTIRDLVICHNVIQHTPNVERTARALFEVLKPGGEFAFNCYRENDRNWFSRFRARTVYHPIRTVLASASFDATLRYATIMGAFRLVPGLGNLLNKFRFCLSGKVPKVPGESWIDRQRRMYRQTVLNTFDTYGSHAFQHHMSDSSVIGLIDALQPDRSKGKNFESYFQRPQPTGIALLVEKG